MSGEFEARQLLIGYQEVWDDLVVWAAARQMRISRLPAVLEDGQLPTYRFTFCP